VIDLERATVQASEPTYELHTLGWKAFQHLCVSIAGEMWGQTVQGYYDGNDGGRDGAFYGTWLLKQGERFEGSFTAQCKFTAKPSGALTLSDLEEELAKAARLAERNLCDNYFLFTNSRLTGRNDEKVRAAFEAIAGLKRFTAFGAERITQFIRESPRLRMLVPRVYGLGDLSQILDARAYAQAQEILSSLGDDLGKFVMTGAYQSSARALVDHGFVLLLGEPACGKSAIAAALALGALDEWGCSTLKIRDAEEFVRHSNPHETRQFFWVDDAFGPTQLDWQAAVQWNRVFPHMQAAMRRGAKIVFTSRDYIYRNARSFLKESALPVLNESQVVIRVENLTKDEREQILYNHIRLGSQPKGFKQRVKPFLSGLASHKRFGPEIARRLGHPAFTKQLHTTQGSLEHFVEHPVALLEEIIRTLDAGSRAAIALVFMRGGMLESPIALSAEEERAVALLGASPAAVRDSLCALDGSLLLQVRQSGSFWWRFKHPTIRDAFGGLVAANRELMDIYLAGTPVEQLMNEISCGAMRSDGVKVVVPPDRYEAIAGRVEPHTRGKYEDRNRLNRFLAHRCDRTFLEQFLTRNPMFLSGLRIMSYLYALADADVIGRLHKVGLLPEEERRRHVAAIRDLAVSTPDDGYLKDHIVSFLTAEERKEITLHVRWDLLAKLDTCIRNWRDNWNPEDDPDSYFDDLKQALKSYRDAFDGDAEAQDWIDAGLVRIDTVSEEMKTEAESPPDDIEYRGRAAVLEGSDHVRSTFDDVDQ
jgi:hypothetical protein